MPNTQFSEDEFEQNLLFELREVYGTGSPHFKPSRVLENSLGYDFAVYTEFGNFRNRGIFVDDNRLRGLLPAQARAILPHSYVSALVQCKVPFYVTQPRPPYLPIWNFWNGRYYRFEIDPNQNRKLIDSEQALQGRALVRYATPCFSTFRESHAFVANGTIVQRTHFQSPSRLNNHHLYTYISPLRQGRAFSEPEDIEPTPFFQEIQNLLNSEVNFNPFCKHVDVLWRKLQKVEGVSEELRITTDDIETAKLTLGPYKDLPLDPLNIVGDEFSFNMSFNLKRERVSLASYASAIFALQRFIRKELKCEWIVLS